MQIEIGRNEAGQRLDRYLRKYFNKAPLSLLYRMVRKDIKVNGRRSRCEYMLAEGDVLQIYISRERAEGLRQETKRPKIKKQFAVVFEDEELLAVNKPAGLLTHGDRREKKNTLAGQVAAYLTAKGDYAPGRGSTFTPSPVNRLDRNTSGLVLFGKTAAAVRALNQLIRQRDGVEKMYCTVAAGDMKEPLMLRGRMVKDEEKNRVRVTTDENGRWMETDVFPVVCGGGFTLVRVHLRTGRTHQIRVQMAEAGYPLIGDRKYGDVSVNRTVQRRCGLSTHLLHAFRFAFLAGARQGQVITAPVPKRFREITKELLSIEDPDGILEE